MNKSEYETPEHSRLPFPVRLCIWGFGSVHTRKECRSRLHDALFGCNHVSQSRRSDINVRVNHMNVSCRGGGWVSFMSASLSELSPSDSISDSSLSFASSCSHYSTQHALLNILKFHGWPVYVLRASGLPLQSLSIIGWNPHWQVRKFVPGVRLGHHCQNFPGNFRQFLNY